MTGGLIFKSPDDRTHLVDGDHTPLDQRNDVVTFRSAPLGSDTAIAGNVYADIWLRSPALDTDVVIKLIDEYPPDVEHPEGFGINVTEGILRGRFRSSLENPTPLTPGEITLFRVEAPDTANLFKAGHRIRLDVASSDYPRFDVNPNTGEPAWKDGERQLIINEIIIDVDHPSALHLCVIK
ncbi:MAG: CocE/NonD family hydrolase [Propionibacteriaceae bacterium]